MATTFPSGNDPFIFSDTLTLNSTDTSPGNLDLHINAFNVADFTTAVPANATTFYLTFAVFSYPNANNGGGTPPQVPIVEILNQGSGFDGPATTLHLTPAGTDAITVGPGQFVNYAYHDLTGGVFQIVFTFDNVPLNAVNWKIRFVINDGVTSPAAQTGLTFVVDGADTRTSWIAAPGQLNLPASGPSPVDFAAALSNITLSGPGAPGTGKQLIAGRSYQLLVPIGNYGTAPLTITGVTPAAATNNFMVQLLANPLVIPPGSVSAAMVQASYAAPAGGQTGQPSQATTFTLTSDDPLAAATGATAHFNTVALYATAGNFEIVLVLDLSGSMGTADAGGVTRWSALQTAVGQVTTQLLNFTGTGDKLGAVVYPSANGNSVGQVVLDKVPIDQSHVNSLASTLSGFNPVDSTPMAGTSTNPGGIFTAGGKVTNPATDCGIFLSSVDPAFARDFRWMIVMSDGMSNVGQDPKTITPDYFTSRRIGVISIGYGTPGGGQLDASTLKAIANASLGTNQASPPNYFGADPATGLPSQQLLMQFEKTVAGALGLNFAADPDAVLAPGSKENQHTVTITEYDRSASFLVAYSNIAEGRIIEVDLISPLGERITPANAASFGLAQRTAILSSSYFAGPAVLHNAGGTPRYGQWTIVVTRGSPVPGTTGDGPAASPRAGLPYAYSVSVESDLTLNVASVNPVNIAGEPIEIVAALSLHGRPLTGAHLTAIIAAGDQGFQNWLAAQTVTAAEYEAALRSLEGLHDVQALFVKVTALAAKGVVYPGTPGSATETLRFASRTGTYRATFPGTTKPGTYQFLITAAGQDDKGNHYTRQQTWVTTVTTRPDAASTVFTITYQLVGGQMRATLRVWPFDRFGNVYLVDPAISSAIQVLLSGGAIASGPLRWHLDASYTQIFTYPPNTNPVVSIVIDGHEVVPKTTPPDFSRMRFVNQVVRFDKGREAKPEANQHTDPAKALGDPSRKPLTDFVSLGGLGQASFDIKGEVIHAQAVTVFVALDADLRDYAVEVLPVRAGTGWIEIGRSRGATQSFALVPKPPLPLPGVKDWYIEVEGRLAGEIFEVKIPLAGRLHAPPDPLTRIGDRGISAVRVRDLSNRVFNPDGTPSASPGVSVQAIGFSS